MKLWCPWCERDDLPLHLLKRHIKYCLRAPRPRGRRGESAIERMKRICIRHDPNLDITFDANRKQIPEPLPEEAAGFLCVPILRMKHGGRWVYRVDCPEAHVPEDFNDTFLSILMRSGAECLKLHSDQGDMGDA
jgi:hypothetical protein